MHSDLHIHTLHSADGRVPMADYCEAALARGIDTLAFTDHAGDYDYDPAPFFLDLAAAKERYAGRLTILAGLEFGAVHRHPDAFQALCALPYDVILGSVHFPAGEKIRHLVEAGWSPARIFDAYWKELHALVDAGGFDVLAHLDFPKLVTNASLYDEEDVGRLLEKAVKKGMVLELNASTVHRPCGAPMPGRDLVSLYAAAGGTRVTTGSDAHALEELGQDLSAVEDLAASLGLRVVTFDGRKMQEA